MSALRLIGSLNSLGLGGLGTKGFGPGLDNNVYKDRSNILSPRAPVGAKKIFYAI